MTRGYRDPGPTRRRGPWGAARATPLARAGRGRGRPGCCGARCAVRPERCPDRHVLGLTSVGRARRGGTVRGGSGGGGHVTSRGAGGGLTPRCDLRRLGPCVPPPCPPPGQARGPRPPPQQPQAGGVCGCLGPSPALRCQGRGGARAVPVPPTPPASPRPPGPAGTMPPRRLAHVQGTSSSSGSSAGLGTGSSPAPGSAGAWSISKPSPPAPDSP